MNDLCEIHAVWIGKELGKIGRCCLASFVKHGHSVYLHTYQEVIDLPEGVIRLDANLIMPESRIFRHTQTGSYAIFADIFRYQLLHKIPNIVYVDTDVYCLKPIVIPEHGYLMGFESDSIINNAVLALPQDSPLLHSLIELTQRDFFIPEWYDAKQQKELKWQKWFGKIKSLADMPWGVTGPNLLTYYAVKHQLTDFAQTADVFYPVPYNRVTQFLRENIDIDDLTTKNTLCVHLYHECLRHKSWYDVYESCVLGKMYRLEI